MFKRKNKGLLYIALVDDKNIIEVIRNINPDNPNPTSSQEHNIFNELKKYNSFEGFYEIGEYNFPNTPLLYSSNEKGTSEGYWVGKLILPNYRDLIRMNWARTVNIKINPEFHRAYKEKDEDNYISSTIEKTNPSTKHLTHLMPSFEFSSKKTLISR